jgi:hypothetical protein
MGEGVVRTGRSLVGTGSSEGRVESPEGEERSSNRLLFRAFPLTTTTTMHLRKVFLMRSRRCPLMLCRSKDDKRVCASERRIDAGQLKISRTCSPVDYLAPLLHGPYGLLTLLSARLA